MVFGRLARLQSASLSKMGRNFKCPVNFKWRSTNGEPEFLWLPVSPAPCTFCEWSLPDLVHLRKKQEKNIVSLEICTGWVIRNVFVASFWDLRLGSTKTMGLISAETSYLLRFPSAASGGFMAIYSCGSWNSKVVVCRFIPPDEHYEHYLLTSHGAGGVSRGVFLGFEILIRCWMISKN